MVPFPAQRTGVYQNLRLKELEDAKVCNLLFGYFHRTHYAYVYKLDVISWTEVDEIWPQRSW